MPPRDWLVEDFRPLITTMPTKKSLKVDREKFEGIVKNLLDTKPVKREDVKVKNPKNREKLIPPQK